MGILSYGAKGKLLQYSIIETTWLKNTLLEAWLFLAIGYNIAYTFLSYLTLVSMH